MNQEESPNNGPSQERLEKPDYINIVESVIGKGTSITWINEENFSAGNTRYLFGFAEGRTRQPDLFIKMAKVGVGDNAERLLHESGIMRAIQELGIPSVRQIYEYQEKDGYAFSCFEKLDMASGELLADNELIASAPAEYGTLAGQALYAVSGKEIPPDSDRTVFKDDDIRNQSLGSFMTGWQKSVEKVLDFDPDKQDVLGQGEIDAARKLTEELQAEITTAQSNRNDKGKKYFVHNDASPNNIFFDSSKGKAILLDFEYAGVTENYLLARITDFGNFYSKLWPSQDLQKAFLSSMIEQADAENLDELYHTLRVVVGYGSMFHAQYVMDPDHAEHFSARSDIDGMFKHIGLLRKLYDQRKEQLRNQHD